MKVYCASRNRYSSDEALLDSLIGQDAWILVDLDMGSVIAPHWIQIHNRRNLVRRNSSGEERPCVYYKLATILVCRSTFREAYEQRRMLTDYSILSNVDLDDIEIHNPIEILSTEELNEQLNYYEDN